MRRAHYTERMATGERRRNGKGAAHDETGTGPPYDPNLSFCY